MQDFIPDLPASVPLSTSLEPPVRSNPRRRRLGRVLATLACVVAPAVAMMILAAVWVRSIRVDEQVELGHDFTILDKATSGVVKGGWGLELETASGVLGVDLGNAS